MSLCAVQQACSTKVPSGHQPSTGYESLPAEYEEGSHVFLAKIATLEGQYSQIRRARGDGNCFFRSFMFAYMEHLMTKQDWRERDR